jgi:hypothetical protein
MSPFEDILARWQMQIDQGLDRIRMFESGEMAIHDTHAPFRDWTAETIATERQTIASLEAGIRKLRGSDAPRP